MDYQIPTQNITGYSQSQLLFGRQRHLPIESDFEPKESEYWDKAIKKRIAQLAEIEQSQVIEKQNNGK